MADNLELVFTILCEDVRVEVGPKLSLMGVIPNIITVQQFPVTLFKFAVVSRWRGQGAYLSEVRIVSPDRQQHLMVSQPTRFEIATDGFAENINFFFHLSFPGPGQYWVQTLVDATLKDEQSLVITEAHMEQSAENVSETVN
ncbi:MAG: hypothetical protein QOF02_2515 [Blastocatellia bacterium]|jgi:hypothetical protein|nr:hypothetical protein [Blastocatellia bacterium]